MRPGLDLEDVLFGTIRKSIIFKQTQVVLRVSDIDFQV